MEKNWTRDETIIAFNVYCKIPFKESSKTNPVVIKYAKILRRSPSALNMKIGNLGRLDPMLKAQGITGLVHGAKIEQEVWDEFYANPDKLAYESECLIAKFSQRNVEDVANIDTTNLPEGKERIAIVKQRVNQSFFRSAVLSSYNSRCCISGINTPELLESFHIVDWAEDNTNRTNPENGLCLNVLFHKAYDKHLLGITPDFKIVISEKMLSDIEEQNFKLYLNNLNGQKIMLPNRFYPKREFLDLHYQKFLQAQ